MGASGEPRWAVVIPLKPLGDGKSRLVSHPSMRTSLSLAFVRDAAAAARACPLVVEVIVVTDDPRATAVLRADGARVVSDVGQGINGAFEHGAAAARSRDPQVGVAALAGDLPALTTNELEQALRAAWDRRRCFVPDTEGTGTSLLTARPGVGLGASFGVASADEHLASGAYLLDLTDCPGLRRDVDTPDDLAVAKQLGLGPATTAALAPD